jgi:hypothetical protein
MKDSPHIFTKDLRLECVNFRNLLSELEGFLITFIITTMRFLVSFTIHQRLFQGCLLPAHENRRTNSYKRGSVLSYDLFAKTLEGVED